MELMQDEYCHERVNNSIWNLCFVFEELTHAELRLKDFEYTDPYKFRKKPKLEKYTAHSCSPPIF